MPALAFMMLQMLVVWGQGIILPKTPSVFMGRKRSHCTRQKSYEPTSPPQKMNECNLKRTISKGKHFFQPEFFGQYSLVFGRNKSLFKCNYEWRSLKQGDANCYKQGNTPTPMMECPNRQLFLIHTTGSSREWWMWVMSILISPSKRRRIVRCCWHVV